jgi:glycosyltransferase involved in cell wall biosynthesis
MNFSNSQYKRLPEEEITKNENLKLVSIVLATYNGEEFLEQQLESLFQQTYTNIEIIAVDDCSSDKTVEILSKYAEKHRNFKVFVNEINLGFIKILKRDVYYLPEIILLYVTKMTIGI